MDYPAPLIIPRTGKTLLDYMSITVTKNDLNGTSSDIKHLVEGIYIPRCAACQLIQWLSNSWAYEVYDCMEHHFNSKL